MKQVAFLFGFLAIVGLAGAANADTAKTTTTTTTTAAKTTVAKTMPAKMWENEKAVTEHFTKHVTWPATQQAMMDACKGHEEGFSKADKEKIEKVLATLDAKKTYTHDEVWAMLTK